MHTSARLIFLSACVLSSVYHLVAFNATNTRCRYFSKWFIALLLSQSHIKAAQRQWRIRETKSERMSVDDEVWSVHLDRNKTHVREVTICAYILPQAFVMLRIKLNPLPKVQWYFFVLCCDGSELPSPDNWPYSVFFYLFIQNNGFYDKNQRNATVHIRHFHQYLVFTDSIDWDSIWKRQ